jgi:hypothetical protein
VQVSFGIIVVTGEYLISIAMMRVGYEIERNRFQNGTHFLGALRPPPILVSIGKKGVRARRTIERRK